MTECIYFLDKILVTGFSPQANQADYNDDQIIDFPFNGRVMADVKLFNSHIGQLPLKDFEFVKLKEGKTKIAIRAKYDNGELIDSFPHHYKDGRYGYLTVDCYLKVIFVCANEEYPEFEDVSEHWEVLTLPL